MLGELLHHVEPEDVGLPLLERRRALGPRLRARVAKARAAPLQVARVEQDDPDYYPPRSTPDPEPEPARERES